MSAALPVVRPAPIGFFAVLDELRAFPGGWMTLDRFVEVMTLRCRRVTARDLTEVLDALQVKGLVGWTADRVWIVRGAR